MTKKILTILLACACLLLAACGGNSQADAGEAAQASDGQNPVMNVVGIYSCERANIQVEAQGAKDAKFTVTWGGSFNEKAVWVMSGPLDTEALSVRYADCVKTNVTYGDDGETISEEQVYVNGHGTFFFDYPHGTLTWQDDQENQGEGLVFYISGYAPEGDAPAVQADAGDPDYYSGVTAMDKAAVEEIAAYIRGLYLEEDWPAFVNLIRFPITISGTELADADAFVEFMADKTVDIADRAAMEDEGCHDMFYNGQGLCMGSGQIWLLDPNYMTSEMPQLQIIAISGIVPRG